MGEIAQLRKQDVNCHTGLWVIRITPEAGTVKTNEAREVVLHTQIIELGFDTFVQRAGAGPLFLKAAADGDVLGPLRGLQKQARGVCASDRARPKRRSEPWLAAPFQNYWDGSRDIIAGS